MFSIYIKLKGSVAHNLVLITTHIPISEPAQTHTRNKALDRRAGVSPSFGEDHPRILYL